MKKLVDNYWAVGLYSFIVIFTTAAVGPGDTDHSLILPDDGPTFTESLIIVSTLDGKLRALDPAQNGRTRWTTAVSDKPLLSSSLSSVQMMQQLTGFQLVPSLDGGLYQFNWDIVEAIPLSADTLLSSSFKLNEGIALVGGKSIKVMGIDSGTGKVIYSCSYDGCNENAGSNTLNDVLVIKRTQKTVRAVSERTGAERWNFSVGQHTLNFLSADQKRHHERIIEENSNTKSNIQVSIPDGLIAGVVKQAGGKDEPLLKTVLWERKFDAPVAAVWLLEDGTLQKLDLLKITAPPKSLESDAMPLMYYIGSHEDQLYIHLSDLMDKSVKEAIEKTRSPAVLGIHDHDLVERSRKRIIWKPYLATSASRTPAIVGKTELTVQKPLDYPFDNGHYFYGQLPKPLSDATCQNNDTNKVAKDSQQGILLRMKKSFVGYWKELVILIFTVGFFVRQFLKYWYKRVALNNAGLDLNPPAGSRKSDESKLKISQSSFSSLSLSQETFVSRYQCDFEHETCLGKGAFGLVFQARNKLDDCLYAVKRIRLPNDDKDRSKVMREVKVLATLDHPGIVRYYNSWCEETPIEWLKEWDEKLKGDSFCPTLSSLASLTETSEESKDLLEISVSDESSLDDEEKMIQNSKNKGSRKRLDTLTVENENSCEKMEWMTYGSESSASSNIEFRPHSFSKTTSKNNGRKTNDDNYVVFFEPSDRSNKDDDGGCSNMSRSTNESADVQTSSVKDNSQLHLLYIQMQLCCRDSLKDWLNSNVEDRNFSMSITIFRQLVDAVEYIHQKGHIHRDLKPSNILFALDGAVKVGDFGLVAAWQPCVEEEGDSNASKKSSNQNLTGQVGTQLYMSPEQVDNREYCSRVDIFSLGIIFFELFYVFKTQMERHNVLTSVRKRNISANFVEEMPLQSKLVLWLLAENPNNRPSAQEIASSHVFHELFDKLTASSSSLQ